MVLVRPASLHVYAMEMASGLLVFWTWLHLHRTPRAQPALSAAALSGTVSSAWASVGARTRRPSSMLPPRARLLLAGSFHWGVSLLRILGESSAALYDVGQAPDVSLGMARTPSPPGCVSFRLLLGAWRMAHELLSPDSTRCGACCPVIVCRRRWRALFSASVLIRARLAARQGRPCELPSERISPPPLPWARQPSSDPGGAAPGHSCNILAWVHKR